jgi:hypothetical protein
MTYLVHNIDGRYRYVRSLKAAAAYVADDLVTVTNVAIGTRPLLRMAAEDYGWSVYPGHVRPSDSNKSSIEL